MVKVAFETSLLPWGGASDVVVSNGMVEEVPAGESADAMLIRGLLTKAPRPKPVLCAGLEHCADRQ